MKSFGGAYGHIIKDTNFQDILYRFEALGINAAHFTNGTFMLPKDTFTPLMLAAQKRVLDVVRDVATPIVVAINSDKSMIDSYVGKNNEAELVSKIVPQEERAQNVLLGLARMFPERPAAVILYDEQTPLELYQALSEAGFGMKSLYKIGYGTEPGAKPIIGAQFFDKVFAFPMPFDAKPVMYADTRDAAPDDRYPDVIEKLTEVYGDHAKPYINKDGKLLMPVPASLRQYAQAPDNAGPDFSPKF